MTKGRIWAVEESTSSCSRRCGLLTSYRGGFIFPCINLTCNRNSSRSLIQIQSNPRVALKRTKLVSSRRYSGCWHCQKKRITDISLWEGLRNFGTNVVFVLKNYKQLVASREVTKITESWLLHPRGKKIWRQDEGPGEDTPREVPLGLLGVYHQASKQKFETVRKANLFRNKADSDPQHSSWFKMTGIWSLKALIFDKEIP